ncbi:MAG: hypothetical protein QT00_C0002G0151 [archaeon GW2011_AR5]|nr:MAG: hypothetical protein QT00_C0002G0151 [archaeon GW2011_AR5]
MTKLMDGYDVGLSLDPGTLVELYSNGDKVGRRFFNGLARDGCLEFYAPEDADKVPRGDWVEAYMIQDVQVRVLE